MDCNEAAESLMKTPEANLCVVVDGRVVPVYGVDTTGFHTFALKFKLEGPENAKPVSCKIMAAILEGIDKQLIAIYNKEYVEVWGFEAVDDQRTSTVVPIVIMPKLMPDEPDGVSIVQPDI